MSFKVGRTFAAAFVMSLLIQMHIATDGYAFRRTKIAFSSARDGNLEIYVMDGDGSNQRRVTVNPARDWLPAWSPDGDTIAYVQTGPKNKTRIHLMTARGKHIKQLGEDHEGSDTGPDWIDAAGWSVSPGANYVTTWGKIKEPASGR